MNELMRTLYDLTRIDRKLVRCRKRILAGPREIAENEAKFKEIETACAALRDQVRDQALDSDRHALEAHTAAAELTQVQQRLRVVKNNSEYNHLNERLRDLREIIDREESVVLQGMEAMDRLRAKEKEKIDEVDAALAALEKLKADVEAEAARIQAEQRELKAKREVALRRVADADPTGGASGAYDASVKRTRGDAMGQMVDNVCQSCFRTQNPNVLDAILKGTDPAAMTCPGCGRILYMDTRDAPDGEA